MYETASILQKTLQQRYWKNQVNREELPSTTGSKKEKLKRLFYLKNEEK